MAIVNRLYEVRTRRGLSQKEIALCSGVSIVTVGRLDRDPMYRPKGETMDKIARSLNLDIGELFGRTDGLDALSQERAS